MVIYKLLYKEIVHVRKYDLDELDDIILIVVAGWFLQIISKFVARWSTLVSSNLIKRIYFFYLTLSFVQ